MAVAVGRPPIPLSIVGLLIAWYLYVQSKRLIREATPVYGDAQ